MEFSDIAKHLGIKAQQVEATYKSAMYKISKLLRVSEIEAEDTLILAKSYRDKVVGS